MSRKKTQSIADALQTLLKDMGIEKKVCEQEVINEWSEIVGSKISAVTQIVRVEDGVLLVRVKNSSWRNELTFLKPKIVEKITQDYRGSQIRDIRFI